MSDAAAPIESGLVEAARRGDADAFSDLVRMHQAVALRVAWSVLGSTTEAEDAVQDAFVKAWRSLHRFRQGAPFRPWLLRIVGNEARNRIRAASRRRRRELAVAMPDLASDDPAADAVDADHRRQLHEAVSRLDARDRAAVVCRYFLELTESETSAVLGIPAGTVKSRLNRARRTLAGGLVTDGDPS